jgi:hypothetical protein
MDNATFLSQSWYPYIPWRRWEWVYRQTESMFKKRGQQTNEFFNEVKLAEADGKIGKCEVHFKQVIYVKKRFN